jgi:hypothetical protein
MTAKPEPTWVEEAKKEIKRLDRKMAAILHEIDNGEIDDIDAWEDINNWEGWRDGISWTLKMREGKTTRRKAWGK